MSQKIIYSKAQLSQVSQKLLEIPNQKIFCLYGSMGAGKTTLVKALVKELGALDPGNSPTFGLVNEYVDNHGQPLAYHFDFYRLQDESEALDMGVEEYLYSDNWVFIEWPEKIPNLIPKNYVRLDLHLVDETTRMVELTIS